MHRALREDGAHDPRVDSVHLAVIGCTNTSRSYTVGQKSLATFQILATMRHRAFVISFREPLSIDVGDFQVVWIVINSNSIS